MIFGASTFSFIRRLNAAESMRRLRGLGYREIDVLAVPGHLWPSELDAAERSRFRSGLERDDIAFASINPQPVDLNLASALPDVRQYSIGVYADIIRLAVDLGAPAVVVVPGRVGAVPPERAATLARAAESMIALSEIAASAGLAALLVENHPTSGLPAAADVAELASEVGAGNVGVAYDVANAESIGEDQVAALRLLGDLVGQTHLSDARPGAWAHDPIGRGTVRFDEILAELDRMSLPATHILEIISPDPETAFADAASALSLPLAPAIPTRFAASASQ
ncbi:sugar phosphate isomerase/epimerase family protein [Microbacterium sp. RD1]|uniref:sugar phosphate isomerase/epimerase family protein n=1 Tax=Microbacterium sp. RD1 TaxID=3457313 RepID=UPI003FA601EC